MIYRIHFQAVCVTMYSSQIKFIQLVLLVLTVSTGVVDLASKNNFNNDSIVFRIHGKF